MKIKSLVKSMVPVCLSIYIAVPSMAADTKSAEDEWQFTLAPLFLWGMNNPKGKNINHEK